MGKIYKALEKSKKSDDKKFTRSRLRKTGSKQAESEESRGAEYDLGRIHGLLGAEAGFPEENSRSKPDRFEKPPGADIAGSDKRNGRAFDEGTPETIHQEKDSEIKSATISNKRKKPETEPEAKSRKLQSGPKYSEANKDNRDRVDSERTTSGRENQVTVSTRQEQENSRDNQSSENVVPLARKRDIAEPKDTAPDVQADLKSPVSPIPATAPSPLGELTYRKYDSSLITLIKPKSFEAEQFKLLRTNILFPASGKPPRSILVTSALPGDGKTFIASNLAISLALNLDQRVLLIDGDIRKPDIHKRFSIDGKRGLSDYLNKGTPLASLLIRTELNSLTILPGGRPPQNPSELLSSEKMPALLKEVTTRYKDRYAIIDSPPPKLTSETSVLARIVDAIILVVRARSTNRELVEELVGLLGKDKIVGVVMNYHESAPLGKYGYNKYGKYYGKYYSE